MDGSSARRLAYFVPPDPPPLAPHTQLCTVGYNVLLCAAPAGTRGNKADWALPSFVVPRNIAPKVRCLRSRASHKQHISPPCGALHRWCNAWIYTCVCGASGGGGG